MRAGEREGGREKHDDGGGDDDTDGGGGRRGRFYRRQTLTQTRGEAEEGGVAGNLFWPLFFWLIFDRSVGWFLFLQCENYSQSSSVYVCHFRLRVSSNGSNETRC